MKNVTKDKLLGSTLHKLAHASETAENVCLALGTRERIRGFSNINSLKYELRHQGFKIIEEDYMNMWKEWQAAGLGTIVLGRGKKQTKFLHYYDMRKIAEAALEGKDIEVESRRKELEINTVKDRALQLDRIAKSIGVAPKMPKVNPEPVIQAQPASKKRERVTNHIFIYLREDVFVDFHLPNDITSVEVDRIRDALNRLVPAAATNAA